MLCDELGRLIASKIDSELIECGCNMHARRYFVKALDAGDQRAALALAAYKKLYTNHEAALARFLDYGEVLDNGIVERLHVRTVLTRKNFLFAGADSGGDRAAIGYSILGSCRLAGVDPQEYLADVLPRLTGRVRLKNLPALLPSRWAAPRAGGHAPQG